jgi:hypothetical protein
MIQVIKIQPTKFLINNKVYDFVKPNFLMKDFGKLIKGKLKGGTLGWHVEGEWVSYNNLKNAV